MHSIRRSRPKPMSQAEIDVKEAEQIIVRTSMVRWGHIQRDDLARIANCTYWYGTLDGSKRIFQSLKICLDEKESAEVLGMERWCVVLLAMRILDHCVVYGSDRILHITVTDRGLIRHLSSEFSDLLRHLSSEFKQVPPGFEDPWYNRKLRGCERICEIANGLIGLPSTEKEIRDYKVQRRLKILQTKGAEQRDVAFERAPSPDTTQILEEDVATYPLFQGINAPGKLSMRKTRQPSTGTNTSSATMNKTVVAEDPTPVYVEDSNDQQQANRMFETLVIAKLAKLKLPLTMTTPSTILSTCIKDFEGRIKPNFKKASKRGWAVEIGIDEDHPVADIQYGCILFTNDEILRCFEPQYGFTPQTNDGARAESYTQALSVQHTAPSHGTPTSLEPTDHSSLRRDIETLALSKTSAPSDAHTSPGGELLYDTQSTQQSLTVRLDACFSKFDRKDAYTDAEIHNISTLLRHVNLRWSKVPRTYIILRAIGYLEVLESCIDVGFSDYWLPVTERNLPDFLPPSARAAFVEAQKIVHTKSTDLEKGDKGKHCSFRKGDVVPLETKAVLGSGGYGQVDKVLSLVSFREYARKRVLRSTAFRGRKKEDVKQFIQEIEILKRLKHHHIVEFVGSYTDLKYIALIMTPIADGDLSKYLAAATTPQFPELRTFFGCLATALEFLHEKNIRHKDIKPGNILVSSGRVLLTDFGLSFDFTDATGSTTMSMVNGMTPRYCAPEVAAQGPRNTKSDIWCLGVVFLEMIATLKGMTVQDMDNFMKQHGTQQAFLRLNIDVLPDFIAHLAGLGQASDNMPLWWIQGMLSVPQESRPTASELVTTITSPVGDSGGPAFCGICCLAPEEDDFSDYASD